jgi:peptidoglycan/LPS O-acetylase OafA/YrhL
MKKISYSRSITSLRGISVIGVLLYHSKYPFFKGGYLGVDIFFIISGFLIGNIIFSELSENNFSFSKFYLRRGRRLIPSLLFTIVLTYVVGYLLFLPEDFLILKYSIPYTLLFIGNIFFWKTNDYFSPSTDILPLSHLWSLAIEEQFYLLFPFFIFLFYKSKFLKKNIKYVILIGALLSFLYSNSEFYNLPFDCPTTNCIEVTNFYWLHTRAWEILIGVSLNFVRLKSSNLNNQLLIFGLLTIIFSFIFTFEEFNHPGIGTVPILFGTVLVIISSLNKDDNFLGRSKILYFFGNISYSLYLIHFPFFVVRNYFAFNLLTYNSFDFLPILLILLSVVVSYFMWKYIETPFRNYDLITNKKFALISTLLVIGLFTISATSLIPNKPQNAQYEKFNFSTDFGIKRDCFFEEIPKEIETIDVCMTPLGDKKNILILGSSIAKNIYSGMINLYQDSVNFDVVIVTGCPPLVEKYNIDIQNFNETKCEVIYKQINKNLNNKNYSKIILSYQWGELIKNELFKEQTLFDFTLDNILTLHPKEKIFFIGQPVRWDIRLDLLALREINFKNEVDMFTSSNIDVSIFATEEIFNQRMTSLRLNYFSLLNYFCQEKKCMTHQKIDDIYYFTSGDFIHITDYFSQKIAFELYNIVHD